MTELEDWAAQNKKDSQKDACKFWILRGPAITASSFAAVCVYFGWDSLTVILSAIAALCMTVDSIHPSGMLRNTHLCAFHELRKLASELVGDWRGSAAKDDKTARQLIQKAEKRKQQIAGLIADAETALRSDIRVQTGVSVEDIGVKIPKATARKG